MFTVNGNVTFLIFSVTKPKITYQSLLQAKWTPGKLLGIFRPRRVTSGFQFVKVIADLSNRGMFGEQTADYVVERCLFFCSFDVMFLRFTFTCLAYFPGGRNKLNSRV